MAQDTGRVPWSVDARGVARVTLNRPEVYNAYNGLDAHAAKRQSEEAAEGFAAFREKRRPRWAPEPNR